MNTVPSPNLLPKSRSIARAKESTIRVWSLAIVASLLLIAIPAGMFSIQLRSFKPVDQQHTTKFVDDLQQVRTTLPPLKKKLAQLQESEAAQTRARTRIQWTTMLDHLGSLTSPDIRIHSFNASINATSTTPNIDIAFQFHSKSLSQAREFLVKLESTALFDKLRMVESRKQSSAPDATVNSTINAQILSE